MLKTKVVLLLALVTFALPAAAQSTASVSFRLTVVDHALTLKRVPKFALNVRRRDDAAQGTRISTNIDGEAALTLAPGDYVVTSEKPLVFENRSIAWEQSFTVRDGEPQTVELSSDNATIDDVRSANTGRDISRGGELFKSLRDGVVTIQGELGAATGFIVDSSGLVLTNQHVIDQSSEIRVRFDKYTAVKARLLVVDKERDLAVLQINLTAFPRSRVLPLAMRNAVDQPVVEGEHVFTIGSPLHQEKILSSGIVSKVEARAIITDITFNSGNSGSPLFNSLGQVVGINTFKIRDRSGEAFAGNEAVEEASGLSGIVTIDEAADLIAKAREIVKTKGLPSAQLMPNMPDGVFPVETIKAAFKDRNYPLKQYVSDVKNYQIKYMTPVYKFYVMEKDRIESLNNRRKRNKEKGVPDTEDAFRDLRYWNEYAGELRPVVQILALPETGASGKSLLLNAVVKGTVGFSTPLDEKYKADFYSMELTCDGKQVVPIIRNKTEIVREMQNYYKERRRYTYAGVYSYPYEVFAPGRCRQMQVQVFSEEDSEMPITSDVPEATKNRIWEDFKDFRPQPAAPALSGPSRP